MDLKLWCKLCYYLFLINGFALSENICTPGLVMPGYTIPNGDIIIEYGNPLNITCVLHDDYVKKLGPNASVSLSFKRNDQLIPQEMIQEINSTAIRLYISEPPKVKGDSYTCIVNDTVVCMNLVNVGTKPQQVTDFDCIGYNHDNLTCTWTPPENYVKTDYNLTFSLKGRASRHPYTCPAIRYPSEDDLDRKMSCFWNISTTPQYRQVHADYYFTLTMDNLFGENKIYKNFKHFSHVLSGPPENLTAISATPSSIYLYWMVPTSMQTFSPGVHHRILYQCEYGDKKWHFAGLLTNLTRQHSVKFNLTHLQYAHELCDIRVSLRSAVAAASDESMWSRNASITTRTSSKVPDGPPKTDVGSFEIVAAGNSLEHREAYIYWQQIDEVQKNGPEFKYVIRVEGYEQMQPVEITNAYAKFKNLSVAKSYTFNIWSMNTKGYAEKYSSVTVPKRQDRISEPLSFTKVEFGDGIYELTWEAPKLLPYQSITNYTIFWCVNEKDRSFQCTGKLNWKVVPSDKTIHNQTVTSNKNHQFAISANSHNSSSGMLWAACTVMHNRNLGKMRSVRISRVGATFMEITWKLDCSDRISSVEGFIIYYCPIKSPTESSCKGPQRNATFYGDTSLVSGTITNLTPYTTYMLTVAVITKHAYSQQSDPLRNTTLEDAPSTPPMNLKALEVTNSSITLSWESPEAVNGVIRDYIIEYNNYTLKGGKKTQWTLSNLSSYQNYLISITACTVRCSNRSKVLNITTEMGYPGKIKQPTVHFQNGSYVSIVWDKPFEPRGRNDMYEVRFKEKYQDENRTFTIVNVTAQEYTIKDCGEDGKYNSFYISVRAINIIGDKELRGPWSDELESYCRAPGTNLIYTLCVVIVLFFVAMAFLFNRLYKRCQEMRKVEVKLPPGLTPVIADHSPVPWSTEKHKENRDAHSPAADEELLLVKINEGSNRHLSGDSSGCSSAHESVTSSLGSNTHMSNCDSGTEQNDATDKGRGSDIGSSYCVLGVNPKMEAYVAVDGKVPYISCDVSSEQSSPYIMRDDSATIKSPNPGYIPFNQNDTLAGGKNPGYVVAGIQNCTGYIPFNQTESKNKNTGYVVAGIKNCKLD